MAIKKSGLKLLEGVIKESAKQLVSCEKRKQAKMLIDAYNKAEKDELNEKARLRALLESTRGELRRIKSLEQQEGAMLRRTRSEQYQDEGQARSF